MRCVIAAALGAAALIALSAASSAHEGHDHGPEPKPAQADASPRGGGASDKFEVVAVAQGEQLVIYLDRFATNEPVRGAKIEIETPEGPVAATADDGYLPDQGGVARQARPLRPDRHGDGGRRHRRAAAHHRCAGSKRYDRRCVRLDVPPERRASAGDRCRCRCRISPWSRGDVVPPPCGCSDSVVADDRVSRRRRGA